MIESSSNAGSRRIIHIINSLDVGGAELMLEKIACGGSAGETYVVCLDEEGQLAERLRAFGVTVSALSMRQRGLFRAIFDLRVLLKNLAPCIVQTWLYHSDLIGGLTTKIFCRNAIIVWNIRNSGAALGVIRMRTRCIIRLNAVLSRWIPDHIVSCSQTAVANHIDLGFARQKFSIIHNGVDLQKFQRVPRARIRLCKELGISPTQIIVGLVARYDPQKDHSCFVRSAALVTATRQDVHFVLVGWRVDINNTVLTGLINEYKLTNNMHLLGQRDDIANLVSAFDVAVNSSLGEGFPNAVAEAMACEVPCVVTAVGDSAQIVGEEGRVVQPANHRALADAVLELIELPPAELSALGSRARKRVEQHFDLQATLARYQAFYNGLR